MDKLKDQYRTKNVGEFPDYIQITMNFRSKTVMHAVRQEGMLFEKSTDLRYGTNSHQHAAVYTRAGLLGVGGLKEIKTGKGGLSQTNFEDMDRALRIVSYFSKPTVAIMKHVNPCGVAQNASVFKAYERAWETDTRAAYGSVIGFNCEVTKKIAEDVMKKREGGKYIEGIVAPSFAEGVAGIFNNASGKYEANPSIRVFEVNPKALSKMSRYMEDKPVMEIKMLGDGSLILSEQYRTGIKSPQDLTVVTIRKPTKKEYDDMIFGWYVCMNTRSNGVVFAKDLATVAIGTGQQERIGAIEQAIQKAEQKMPGELKGSVLVSDGFLPNADNIESIVKHGITAIIQPGGSVKDEEIIAMCNEVYTKRIVGKNGIAMAFTAKPGENKSERCFAHF